jgi:hypothetical protein
VFHYEDADPINPARRQANAPGGGFGQVDDAALASAMGPAIVDGDHYLLPRPQIRHLHLGPEREGAMRRRQLRPREACTARRRSPLMRLAIPGGPSDLGVPGGLSVSNGGDRDLPHSEEP